MLLADGVYSIVAHTSVQYYYVFNKSFFSVDLENTSTEIDYLKSCWLRIVAWFCLSKAVVVGSLSN